MYSIVVEDMKNLIQELVKIGSYFIEKYEDWSG